MSSEDKPNEDSPALDPSATPEMAETLCYAFEQLSTGAIEVQITFEGQVYRLRKTRNGRLILTK